jgi:hypothetical protein
MCSFVWVRCIFSSEKLQRMILIIDRPPKNLACQVMQQLYDSSATWPKRSGIVSCDAWFYSFWMRAVWSYTADTVKNGSPYIERIEINLSSSVHLFLLLPQTGTNTSENIKQNEFPNAPMFSFVSAVQST